MMSTNITKTTLWDCRYKDETTTINSSFLKLLDDLLSAYDKVCILMASDDIDRIVCSNFIDSCWIESLVVYPLQNIGGEINEVRHVQD